MEDLRKEVVTWLKQNEASVVGVSSVDRFHGAPEGHHPLDFVPNAKSVITFGVALLQHSLHWETHLIDSDIVPQQNRNEVLQNYFYHQTGYALVNDLLDRLALRLSNLLEGQGYPSLFFPATYGRTVSGFIQEMIPSGWGLLSQRHAAVMAGLGEFGMNNVVVTEQHGPRIRFNSVITEAELMPSALLTEKLCLGESCSLCIQACPGAISLREDCACEAVWHVTPARTDVNACRKLSGLHYCLGRCIKVCPVGKTAT